MAPTSVNAVLAAATVIPFEKTLYRGGEPEAEAVVDYPTIAVVSKTWTLNEMQHNAFVLMASAVLDRVICKLEQPEGEIERGQQVLRSLFNNIQCDSKFLPKDTLNSNSLRMYLAGCGGCGKSRVIKALNSFSIRRGVKEMVVKTATTGVAATLLSGMTYFSALNVGAAINKKKVSAAVRLAWDRVWLLIVDEVSFIGRKKLARIERRLRLIKGNNLLFGGVHVVFAGDFYQLKNQELDMFADPTDDNINNSKATLDDITGFELWTQSLNCSIELVENYRAISDPDFAGVCFRLRTNTHTLNDIKYT